jgi:hypothetical protein
MAVNLTSSNHFSLLWNFFCAYIQSIVPSVYVQMRVFACVHPVKSIPSLCLFLLMKLILLCTTEKALTRVLAGLGQTYCK